MEFWKERRGDLDTTVAISSFDRFFSGRWVLYADPLDSVFSQSCARIYQSMVEASEPRSDETDVVAHWTGYGRRRGRFRRLMLPFRSGGRKMVLSGIDMDTNIDLLE